MTPVEQAKAICEQAGGCFRDELEAHLLNGIVISTPELFLMGRPVPRGAMILDPWANWPREACDAWFVWVGVGGTNRLLALMPYPLPWLGWWRTGRGWHDIHWRRLTRFQSALRKAAIS